MFLTPTIPMEFVYDFQFYCRHEISSKKNPINFPEFKNCVSDFYHFQLKINFFMINTHTQHHSVMAYTIHLNFYCEDGKMNVKWYTLVLLSNCFSTIKSYIYTKYTWMEWVIQYMLFINSLCSSSSQTNLINFRRVARLE